MRSHGVSEERSRAHRSSTRAPEGAREHGLMGLQRTAGNASVSALLAGRPVVQRGLFDMLGGLLGGGGGIRNQAAAMAGQGVQQGVGALGGMIGGDIGQTIGGAGGGLATAASSLIGGDTGGALSALQQTGMQTAAPLAQQGMSMLGNAIGGQAGGLISSLGGTVGQGLTSVISGGNPMQAGMGVLQAAAPQLMQMASGFLGKL